MVFKSLKLEIRYSKKNLIHRYLYNLEGAEQSVAQPAVFMTEGVVMLDAWLAGSFGYVVLSSQR